MAVDDACRRRSRATQGAGSSAVPAARETTAIDHAIGRGLGLERQVANRDAAAATISCRGGG
jgi:hypothetical protein